jgi:hypothetical protein
MATRLAGNLKRRDACSVFARVCAPCWIGLKTSLTWPQNASSQTRLTGLAQCLGGWWIARSHLTSQSRTKLVVPTAPEAGKTLRWDAWNDQITGPKGYVLEQVRHNYSDPIRVPTGKDSTKYRGLKLTCQAHPNRSAARMLMPDQSVAKNMQLPRSSPGENAKTKQDAVLMKLRKERGGTLRPSQAYSLARASVIIRPMWGKRRIPPCGVVIALKLAMLKGRIFSARYLRRFMMKNRRYSDMHIPAIL